MNIQIRCEATLSKKLEKICESGEPIDIRLGGVKGNRAEAVIRLPIKAGISIDEVAKLGITSIEFRILEVGEEAPILSASETAVHSLFSREAQISPTQSALITAVEPLKKESKVQSQPLQAPVPKNAMQSPALAAPPATPSATFLQPILTYAELMENLIGVKGIDVPLPEMVAKDGSGRLSRVEAAEYEKKMQGLPRLMRPVYIGAISNIVINDLNQAIKSGEIMDFSKIPAKRLAESRDLRGLLLQKHLKFCSEVEYMTYLNTMGSLVNEKDPGLAVGSSEEMKALMETGIIPPELANKKGAKPIAITADTREVEQIDLDAPEPEGELDAAFEIFQQISNDDGPKPQAAPRPAPKPSSSVKSIRRSSQE